MFRLYALDQGALREDLGLPDVEKVLAIQSVVNWMPYEIDWLSEITSPSLRSRRSPAAGAVLPSLQEASPSRESRPGSV